MLSVLSCAYKIIFFISISSATPMQLVQGVSFCTASVVPETYSKMSYVISEVQVPNKRIKQSDLQADGLELYCDH